MTHTNDKRLLLVEDDPVIRLVVTKIINDLGYQVICPESYAYGLSLLLHDQFKLVVIESSPVVRPYFNQEWLDAIKKDLDGPFFVSIIIYILKTLSRIPEFIFISRESTQEEVEFADKNGAVDFIQIPVKKENNGIESYPEKIKRRLSNAIKRAASIADGSIFQWLNLEGMVCESWAMKRVLLQLVSVLRNDENVIISGEWGTGKSTFARTIHYNSRRKDESYVVWDFKPFVTVGNTLILKHLLFDGLKKRNQKFIWGGWSIKRVLYELNWLIPWEPIDIYELYADLFANFHYTQPDIDEFLTFEPPQQYFPKNGTVHLHLLDYLNGDRLDTLSHDMLRNDAKGRPFRYILSFLKDSRSMSPSLFTRCAKYSIHLPRLAERREDIAGIAKLELHTICRDMLSKNITLSSDFIKTLESYDWPRNLLELSEVLKYAAGKIGENETFEVTHLPAYLKAFGALQQIPGSLIENFKPPKSAPVFYKPNKVLLLSEDIFDHEIKENRGHEDSNENPHIEEKPVKITKRDNMIESREICYFYKDDKSWRIGTSSNSLSFKYTKGLRFLHFLIRHPNKDLPSDLVYNDGAKNDQYRNFVEPPQDKYDDRIQIMTIGEVEEALKRLESEETKSDDHETEIMRKEIIDKMRRLKKAKAIIESSKYDQKSRTTVTKGIRRAIEQITKKIPEMTKYLDVHTVKTGYIMRYEPIEFDTPEWVLFESELPHKKS